MYGTALNVALISQTGVANYSVRAHQNNIRPEFTDEQIERARTIEVERQSRLPRRGVRRSARAMLAGW